MTHTKICPEWETKAGRIRIHGIKAGYYTRVWIKISHPTTRLRAASNYQLKDNIADQCIQALRYTASTSHQRWNKRSIERARALQLRDKAVEETEAVPQASSI